MCHILKYRKEAKMYKYIVYIYGFSTTLTIHNILKHQEEQHSYIVYSSLYISVV